MTITRKTLLERVRDSSDHEAWTEFYELYAPLIYRYARGRGLPSHDAEEIRDTLKDKEKSLIEKHSLTLGQIAFRRIAVEAHRTERRCGDEEHPHDARPGVGQENPRQ